MIAFIVANTDGKYSHSLIRETSILCLCRYMTISSILCEKYLPLFFTILEREKNENIRTTMMISTGDFCVRFPNTIEPWTSYLYSRLSDENVIVRYNTLMVLTHLILNDMIKVKGQVSSIVMCLVDSCDKIQSLTQLFFTELSKRSNNPVYNLLGDIIGNLSREGVVKSNDDEVINENINLNIDNTTTNNNTNNSCQNIIPTAVDNRQISQKEFQETMNFLLSFVTKDK